MVNYIYGIASVLTAALSCIGLNLCLKRVPAKIKLIGVIIYFAFILRSVSLICFFTAGNIKYLFYLKSLYFLNFAFIPICALTLLYILWRNDKLNFNIISGMSAVILGIYIIFIINAGAYIKLDTSGTYSMLLDKYLFYDIFIGINALIFFAVIIIWNKNTQNKSGIYCMLISSMVNVVEYLLFASNMYFFPECILGDLCWVITSILVINKFKK